MGPRVTNNDLNERLIRIETATGQLTTATAETAQAVRQTNDSVQKLSDSAIRTESSVKEHESKIGNLYTKVDDLNRGQSDLREKAIQPVAEKTNKIINYGTAIGSVVALMSGGATALGMWFLNQQASALQSISENVRQVVQAQQQLDHRLTIVELKQQLGITPANQKQSEGDTKCSPNC